MKTAHHSPPWRLWRLAAGLSNPKPRPSISDVEDASGRRLKKGLKTSPRHFEPTGAFVRQFGAHGSAEGQFDSPGGVAVSPDGKVYVTDCGNGRFQVYSS